MSLARNPSGALVPSWLMPGALAHGSKTGWRRLDARRGAGAGRAADGAVSGDAALGDPLAQLSGWRRRVRRPRQLRNLHQHAVPVPGRHQQPVYLVSERDHRGDAGVSLRLRADAHLHAVQGLLPGGVAGAHPCALAAAGHRPDLHFRQPGVHARLAVRRVDLRPHRHRDRHLLLGVSARADDPDRRVFQRRCASLRGITGAQRGRGANLLHGDAALGPVWPDQRVLRVFHAGDRRFRRA